MARSSPEELIAELEAALVAMPKAVRALLGPPRGTQFGEYERVEESKFSPPAPPHVLEPEEGELPESYGCTRLVMLVTGPYRVHAYWEVTPDTLAEAERKTQGHPGPAHAVLRFYDAAGANHDAGWFDVEVDLQARNWYIQFWRADKTYRAHLGLRGSDGQFTALAGSNLVRTPRALPKVELAERFMRVEPARQRVRPERPPVEPRTARPEPPPALDPAFRESAVSAPSAGERPGVEPVIVEPAIVETAIVEPAAEEPAAEGPVVAPAAVAAVEAPQPPAARVFSTPVDASETLKKKLAELYAHRHWLPEPPKAVEQPAEPAPVESFENPRTDLTAMAEETFAPGVSSVAAPRKHAGA